MLTIQEIGAAGADLAEVYSTNDSSVNMGDVVSLDPSLQSGVMKSSKAYDSQVLGVISTAPALTIGGDVTVEGVRDVPVALSGRVPVKVSAENGPIQAGDALTSSSTPGVAMKATKAGSVIGMAMSDFSGTGVGLVTMFVKNGDGLELSSGATDALSMLNQNGLQTVNIDAGGNATISGTLTVDTLKVNHIEGLDVLVKTLTSETIATPAAMTEEGNSSPSAMTPSGPLTFDGVATFLQNILANADMTIQGALHVMGDADLHGITTFFSQVFFKDTPIFNSDTGGIAVIPMSATSVTVPFTKPFVQAPIVTITLTSSGATDSAFLSDVHASVTDVSGTGFTIVITEPVPRTLIYNWLAIAVADPRTVTGSSPFDDTSGVVSPIPTEPPNISPTTSPTVIPTVTIVPTPIPSPTIQLTPVASPSAMPTP
jgi:hypothetical protein